MAESLRRHGGDLLRRLEQTTTERLLASVARTVEINFPEEILTEVATLIACNVPIMIDTNHQSHADIILLALVAHQIRSTANAFIETGLFQRKEPFPGFLVPMAVTVLNGKQSQSVTQIYQTISPWLEQKGIMTKAVTRDRDREVYGTGGLPPTTSSTVELLRANANGFGLAILIAGTVDEGRRVHKQTDERKGMKRINGKNIFTTVVANLHGDGINAAILPVGFSESYRLFDPDTRIPTLTAVKAVVHNLNPTVEPKKLASATVGQLMMTEDIWLTTPPEETQIHSFWNNYVLSAIAQLLPPSARGEFL